jgi:hypothetical protein
MMQEVFKIEIAGYDIVLLQNDHDNFTVQYGAEIESNLDYSQAAKSMGFCIMHALSCDGKLDDGE